MEEWSRDGSHRCATSALLWCWGGRRCAATALGPAYTGPKGTGSLKSTGRSVTPLGRTDFAAARGGGKGGVESLGKADVTCVGRGDSIAVSIVMSFILKIPRSHCKQRHSPSAGAPGVSSGGCVCTCPSPGRAAGSERSLSALPSNQKGNTESKEK